MVKVMGMVKRKKGISLEEFSKYWSEKHAPLGLEILPRELNIIRYVQNYALNMDGSGEAPFDGIVEFCFEDMESFQKWMEWFMGDGGKPLRDDEQNFIDPDSRVVMLVEENVILPLDHPH